MSRKRKLNEDVNLHVSGEHVTESPRQVPKKNKKEKETEVRLSAVLSAGALLVAREALHNAAFGSDLHVTDQVA